VAGFVIGAVFTPRRTRDLIAEFSKAILDLLRDVQISRDVGPVPTWGGRSLVHQDLGALGASFEQQLAEPRAAVVKRLPALVVTTGPAAVLHERFWCRVFTEAIVCWFPVMLAAHFHGTEDAITIEFG
jgi:hypothetical protein